MKEVINQKGMTLVEVLIVAAIMGVLSIGFATIFSNAFKNEANLSAKQATREFRDELEYGIANYNCGLPSSFFVNPDTKKLLHDIKANVEIPIAVPFVGPRQSNIEVGTKYDKMTVVATAIGPFLPALNMQFASLIFPNPALLDNAAYRQIMADQPYYSAEIRITLEKQQTQGASGEQKAKEYVISRHFIILTVDNVTDKQIIGCQSYRYISDAKSLCLNTVINGSAGTWNELGDTYDPESRLFTCLHEVAKEGDAVDNYLEHDDPGSTTTLSDTMESSHL